MVYVQPYIILVCGPRRRRSIRYLYLFIFHPVVDDGFHSFLHSVYHPYVYYTRFFFIRSFGTRVSRCGVCVCVSLVFRSWPISQTNVFYFFVSSFKIIGLLSLWTSTWCDCDTEMCQHNHNTTNTYNGNDFFCSSLFTQKKSTHYQRKSNKHSIASATSTRPTKSIASIGMSICFFFLFSCFLCSSCSSSFLLF